MSLNKQQTDHISRFVKTRFPPENFPPKITTRLKHKMMNFYINSLLKGKCKVHPRTGHDGPEGEWRCYSTLSLTSALDGVGG